MTPATFKRAALALALCGAASCSLMVDYDLEGKPCGNNKTCLEGYVCIQNACLLSDEDAGTTAKRDGGARDGGPLDAGGPGDAEEPDADLGIPDV
ncbi:MAG TPA: hypothetical protein VGK67_23485 [Myxococcales bacterium]|jgi:hypothetical protein